ncbi:hypothetical protein SPSYN_01235 [Sporotomaculum syntrophicum]|uniref:Uncharacterized protein n=1 Tax=Sporotomaculum syntrophicum TaxID=182264 RepID=A0A9D2WPR0_9FIRM|nr:hypothetical protein [Sporotomaculum syntrophicum]KAF1085099.1 hypothetical protein SPSYN_01235 [Sporotomaculum syntrophicum]
MKRCRCDEFDYVHEWNTTSDKSPDWVNELIDFYFPDNEKIDLARGNTRNYFEAMTTSGPDLLWRSDEYGYVHEGNAETDRSPNFVKEFIDYYFLDKETIDQVRGKTRITFRFWGLEQPSKKASPRKLIFGKLVG